MTRERLRHDALALFREGLAAVDPWASVKRSVSRTGTVLQFGPSAEATIDLAGVGDVVVVGAGKASAYMGAAIEELLGGHPSRGAVVIPHGQSSPLAHITTLYASHPVPDDAGVAAARAIAAFAGEAGEKDLVIALFSGGGSALLPAPAGAITLEEKQQVTRLLLRSGASIAEVNTIRKHLSFLKGGRLCRLASPARVIALMISDVVGDDLSTIASGPTSPDPSTCADALRLLERYAGQADLPRSVLGHLTRAADESPKPGDPVFASVVNLIVARNADALVAMESKARALGYVPVILPVPVQGEARRAALEHVRSCRNLTGRPLCVLSGGETTVTVTGEGRGGRNQEFALAAAMAMDGWGDTVLLSAGTDGIDGASTAAGAYADGTTCSRARSLGLNPDDYLVRNDSNSFFLALGDLLVTGATGTNVMDVQIVLCA